MDDPFPRSRQSLAADASRLRPLAVAGAALLLAAWCGWLFLARVGVYAVSDQARLEVAAAAQPVEAEVSGRLGQVRVALGDAVEAGDVLFEIEAEAEALGVAGAESRLRGLERQVEELRAELEREQRAQREQRKAALAELRAAESRQREAEEAATHAEEQASRMEDLHGSGLVSEVQLSDARTEARQRRAAADTARAQAIRLRSQADALSQTHEARIAELQREGARLEGEIEETRRAVERGVYEVGRRQVTAPVSGTVAELAELSPGAVIEAGDRLATVVPAGEIRIVARFAPADALGRIAVGQRGRMRLEGFSWTHFGALSARVSGVAAEPRDGRVRVELDLADPSRTAIPIRHGLTGTVEVEVERVSPAALALRAAGRRLDPAPAGRPSAADGGA